MTDKRRNVWKAKIVRWNGQQIDPIPVEVIQQLSPKQGLRINCDDLPENVLRDRQAKINLDLGTAELDVILASYSMNEHMRTGRVVGSLAPRITPCVGEQPDTAITLASSYLYCFPRFYGYPSIEQRLPASSQVSLGGIVKLSAGPWHIVVVPVDDLETRETTAQQSGEIYASHSVRITQTDETEVFWVRDLLVLLQHLRAFFSFVRGQNIGVSTVSGFNSHTQQRSIVRWGLGQVQPFTKREMLLSPINTGGTMADIFSGYYDCVTSESGEVFLQAIDSYLCANETSFVLAVPIIQSALEGLVGLSQPPRRWSKMGGFRGALEKALLQRNIPIQIPAQLTNLEGFAQRSNLKHHGVHAFVKIRNLIIHAIQDHRDAFVFYEAGELGAWYVEMLLLSCFNYSGKYRNRLVRDHNMSPYVSVPW